MSAKLRVREAQITNGMDYGSLSRGDPCHPHRAYGLKKGLRRARRRIGKAIIREELVS